MRLIKSGYKRWYKKVMEVSVGVCAGEGVVIKSENRRRENRNVCFDSRVRPDSDEAGL